MRLLLAAALLLLLLTITDGQETGVCPPAPQNFSTLFSQECLNILDRVPVCQVAWDKFIGAFAGMDASQVTPLYVDSLYNCIYIHRP